MSTVAIIGSGPSGLVAAKEALECGLNPTVFEMGESIGGLWKPKSGHTWETMRTNISHNTCNFSDFEWKNGIQDFPTQGEVYEYLCSYADSFKIHPHVRLNTEVRKVERSQDKWTVETLSGNKTETKTFDYVIIASGIFTKAHTPKIPGLETFQGTILHAKDYKTPDVFSGKSVVVIGNAFSGSEIATEIASKTDHVVNVVHRPMWVLPRYLGKQNNPDVKVPADLIFYSRAGYARSIGVPDDVVNQRKNTWFKQICKEQEQVSEDLVIKADPTTPPFVTISDGYVDKIKTGSLKIKVGDIKEVKGNKLIFQDESTLTADALVFCTGYRADIPFLNSELQALMGFVPEDPLQPFLLQKAMFPKDLPGLACVGMYRGPFFGVMELQARIACMAFSKKIPLPTEQEIETGVKEEKKIRDAHPRPQFPHGGYVGFCEELAGMIGVRPDFDQMKTQNPQLYDTLWNGPFSTASYRLIGFGSKPDVAKRIIEQTHKAMKD